MVKIIRVTSMMKIIVKMTSVVEERTVLERVKIKLKHLDGSVAPIFGFDD